MKGFGILNAFTVMRTLALFLFFTGSWDHSKDELFNALNRHVIIRFFIYALIVLLIVAIITTAWATFVSHSIMGKPTTFNISVVTEEVKVITHDTPMSRWPLTNIALSTNCPDEPEEIQYQQFTGSISLNSEIQIIITRIAAGDLSVKLYSPKGKPVGVLYDDEDENVGTLSECAFFHVRDIAKRADAGETVVLPITGDIFVGHEIRFLTHHKNPVLRSGNITILDKAFATNENYSVGPFTLETGDSFTLEKPSVPSQGFALVDANPAIHLVYRGKGSRGVVKRYQAEDYELRNSFWSKLYNDESLSLAWVGIVLILGVIRVTLRLIMVNYNA